MRKFYHRFVIVLTLLCSTCLWQFSSLTARAVPVLTDAEERIAIPVETNEIENWPDGPDVSAQSAILIDADTGTILYGKNVHEQLYPASTTKILTCLIATEQCSLDEIVTFSKHAIYSTEGSHIALDVGEELTVEQCLNAILIASANDASFGLAEHITGTDWEDFADIMNERAKELGCVDSHFVNPNGLPDENHYTSAYDLAMIGRAFFANELLCKISSSALLDIPPSDKQPDHILERSKNQLLPGKPYAYEYLVGSKTGYTDAARSTLVSCAEKDGMKLIAVVMVEDSPSQFADTVALFNYGFNNFDRINISETETRFNIDNASFFYSDNDIFGSSKPILALNKKDCITLPKTVSFDEVSSTISYNTGKEGQAALITYSYNGVILGSASVDFANDATSHYSFEESTEGAMQPAPGASSSSNDPEQKVIFINVVRVFLWIAGIAGGIILLIIIFSFFRNYHFGTRERSDRRSWLKNRKRKKSRYQRRSIRRLNRRRDSMARRRGRQAKRPSRFRDYDF
ncbi:MAG: D-alanyl-D-alanine carboxypeptidase family protein [Lachnospiraceae bacterium]